MQDPIDREPTGQETANNELGLPRGLTIGIVIVFITMVLGTCFLVIFLYNLPVIFPPPAQPGTVAGLATPTPTLPAPRAVPSLTPTSVSPTLTNVPPTPSPAVTRAPAAAPPNGHIVFVTERMGFNSIFIMNADGTGQRLLVPHTGSYYDYSPAVSPDGRRLAFSSNREKPGTDNIYIMNIDGSSLTKITSTPNAKNASASWFPDNRQVAFVSNRTGRWQVYTMNDDGSNQRQIISSEQDSINVAVSPNGAQLAFLCGREICLANPDGSNVRALLQNGLPKDHLAWSPDSSLIAFTQASPGSSKTSIYVLDMQGNNRQVVANGGWPSWSSDGTRLAFSSDMEGTANLYAYNLSTGQISKLTTTNAADVTPIWTR